MRNARDAMLRALLSLLPLYAAGLMLAGGSVDAPLTGESPAATNSAPAKAAESAAPTKAPDSATRAPLSPDATENSKAPTESKVATLRSSDLKDFADQPVAVQRLIIDGLVLTTRDLGYKYGSSDPENGGMDCSGTVYYLLTQEGLKDVPRDSAGMYRWVWTESSFQAVVSSKDDTFELDRLRPGDLLFWTGTYRIDRDPPVTHVMIYLGINKLTGRRVMLGASEGRTFNGTSRYGVSVFDFKLPRPQTDSARDFAPVAQAETPSTTRFIGYGPVPVVKKPLAP
jgi:cell wall-associated NlpC family hydrolase